MQSKKDIDGETARDTKRLRQHERCMCRDKDRCTKTGSQIYIDRDRD